MSTYHLPQNVRKVLTRMSDRQWHNAYGLNVNPKILEKLVATGFCEVKYGPGYRDDPKVRIFYRKL